MPRLGFACVGAVAEPYAASPSLLFTLRVSEDTGIRIHTVALRCQLRIEPHRRRYSASEASRLTDLFGEPSRWGDTLKPMQLATVGVMVQGFTDSIEVPVSVPLSADTEVATGKYFHGLDDGEIPVLMLFSGTAFYHTEAGIQVELVPWHLEVSYRLPLTVWRQVMDQHFPDSTWLSVRTETHTALQRYRAERGTLNWDDTVADLLKRVGES